MQITKIKWKDHAILGNLELDFINPNTNQPFNTILFAGENGTCKAKHHKHSAHPNGKTTYDTLCTYIRNAIDHPSQMQTFDKRELRNSIEFLIDIRRYNV